ncbi:hypothetical protein [Flavobacterium flavipallidum]|uniref:TIGR04255 family protein n=1 Tax=Flavobacterium flavipallidum TaxID=3139140 RepID=A0ABU9HHJ6_9FLAO
MLEAENEFHIDLEFFNSDSFRRILSIELFKDVEDIFERNYKELLNVRDDSGDLKRVIHNFLMSNSTLIDQTRRLIVKCPKIETEFRLKISKKYANSPLNSFVKDLRNYNTHYSLPLIMKPVEIEEGKLIVKGEVMDKNSLLKWRGWSSLSLTFINEQDNSIDIQSTFNDHFNNVAELYNWLNIRLKELYFDDFEKYNNLLKVTSIAKK